MIKYRRTNGRRQSTTRPDHVVSKIDSLNIKSKIAFSSVAQIAVSLISAGISIMVLHLSTAHLGPSNYGFLTTIVALITILTLLTDLGLTALTSRDIAKLPQNAEKIINENLSLRIIMSLGLVPIATTIAYLLYPTHRAIITTGVLLMSADIVFNTIQTTSMAFFSGRTRSDVAAVVFLGGKCAYLAAVAVASVLHRSIFFYLGAYLVGDGIAALLSLVKLRQNITIRWQFDRTSSRRILTTFPLGLLQTMAIIYLWTGTIFISIYRSSSDVAFYGVCSGFLVLVATMANYFMTAVVPTLATADRDVVPRIIQRAWDTMAILAFPIATGAVLLRQDIVGAVAGHRFISASGPFGILGAVVGLMFMNNVFAYAAIALDTFRSLIWIQFPCLLLQIALNVVLIPTFGVNGAGLAILGSEVCSLVATFLLFRHKQGIRISIRSQWRPATSAVSVVGFDILFRGAWTQPSAVLDVAIGSLLLGTVYVLVLAALGGLPPEISGVLHKKVDLVARARRRHRQSSLGGRNVNGGPLS